MAARGAGSGSAVKETPKSKAPPSASAGRYYNPEFHHIGEPFVRESRTGQPEEGQHGPVLPPGITSMKMWGRCKVNWGKAARNATYEQIAQAHVSPNTKDPLASYCHWALIQKGTTCPQLTDLRQFLQARLAELDPDREEEICFPGTDIPRVFEKPGPNESGDEEPDFNDVMA